MSRTALILEALAREVTEGLKNPSTLIHMVPTKNYVRAWKRLWCAGTNQPVAR